MSVRSTLSDLFNERTNYDFVGRTKIWMAMSAAVIGMGLVSLVTQGLVFGIDFEGGTSWQVEMAKGSPSVERARDALEGLGLGAAKIQALGGKSLRVQFEHIDDKDQQEAARTAIADYAGVDAAEVSVSDVGPTWGGEVSRKATRALVVFLVVIALYLSWRFEPKMAGAAIVALLHDLLVTVGVYSVARFEVSPATVVAILTILGFSLYDTVVVFDKVDENVSRLATGGGETYGRLVNRSLNEVLMRSLNTSLVALLPVASMLVVGSYVLGALVIRDFALALFVGLLTGAYSSVFVATPILAAWKEREPRFRALRNRVGEREAAARIAVAAAGESAGVASDEGSAPTGWGGTSSSATTAPPDQGPGAVAPRGRKKGKRR